MDERTEVVTERETAFDQSKPFKTRDGREVRAINIGLLFVHGMIGGDEWAWWKTTGRSYVNNRDLDLVNVPPAAPVAQPGTEDAESDAAFVERIGREYDDMEGDPEPFEMRRLIALAAETIALRAAMSDAISLLQETTHGSPARSPGHNARVVLQAALAKRGLTGDWS